MTNVVHALLIGAIIGLPIAGVLLFSRRRKHIKTRKHDDGRKERW